MVQQTIPRPELPGRPRACVDTQTGDVIEARWVTHKDIDPDTNGHDPELFDTGIPRRLDNLVTALPGGRFYRRKIRAIIRRGGLRYLLAAGDIAKARGEDPAAYFATMTARKNWRGTIATLIRTGAHTRYIETDARPDDEYPDIVSPYRKPMAALAAGWITAALTANGPMASSDFAAKAKADGVYTSYGTFNSARKCAGVLTGKVGTNWWVWLPDQERPVNPDNRNYLDDPMVLAASDQLALDPALDSPGSAQLGPEVPTPGEVPTPSNYQPGFKYQGIEGSSIGAGNPGQPDQHYRRFAKSCTLAPALAEFNSVPRSSRLHRNQQPRHVSVPELDELLDAYHPAAYELGPCVLWTGAADRDGYGIFRAAGKKYQAGRWLWELRQGPIGRGLEMAHHTGCPHRNCILHVSPQTKRANLASRRKPGTRVDPAEAERARRDEIRRAKVNREHEEFMAGKRGGPR